LGVALVGWLFVFLGAVSVKLYRRRPGALQYAGYLLQLEVGGAVLLLLGADIDGGCDLGLVLVWLCIVFVIWVAPNAFAFYRARSLFVESETKKPGL
jgi:hypothetical protein